MKTKKCSKCGEVKSVGEFYKQKETCDGLQYQCKCCALRYRAENKERINRIDREYHHRFKINRNKKSKNYYHKNSFRLKKRRSEEIKQDVAMLVNSYVAQIIKKQSGLLKNEIPIELIKTKRLELKLHRKIKSLKKELKNEQINQTS